MSGRIQNVHPREYKGVKYKSTLEAQTAEVLDKLGLPIRYEERTITLLDGFRCPFQKDKVRAITYTPDFWVGDIILECKGFETPEWRNKKKYIFKYLQENEPEVMFYQTKNSRRDVLKALDHHWSFLGFAIEVTPKPKGKNDTPRPRLFDSVEEAMKVLKLEGKPIGTILASLIGEKQYTYGYQWKLVKLEL